VSDTGLVLLTAAVLSGVTFGGFVWRVGRLDPTTPQRLIGELRVAQAAAILIAALGAMWTGLAVAASGQPATHIDAALGIGFVMLAVFIFQREPREALLAAAGAFILLALVALAHRPGLLPVDIAPRWFAIGTASYAVVGAALCFWTSRR